MPTWAGPWPCPCPPSAPGTRCRCRAPSCGAPGASPPYSRWGTRTRQFFLYLWKIGECKSPPTLGCMVMAHPTALPRTALGRTQRLNARCSAYAGMWCKQFKAVDARATPWAGGAETRDVPHNRPLAVRWHLQPVADDAGGWSGPGCEMLLNKGSRASGMASQKWDWGSRPGPGAAWGLGVRAQDPCQGEREINLTSLLDIN